MSTPVLQVGDQIHVVVPASFSDSQIEEMRDSYAARGVNIFMASAMPRPDIEIISVIRAESKPTAGQMMTGFMPPRPPGAR